MLTRSVILATAAGMLLAGCSSGPDGELPADAAVTYSFTDASVPPPYHRSFVLTVTAKESRIVVDSYGDVLADESLPTRPQAWDALREGYPAIAELSAEPTVEGCVGGTSFELVVAVAGEPSQELGAEVCGGAGQEFDEAVRAWISPALDQFPPIDELAPEGE
jgi:hypothetical protein